MFACPVNGAPDLSFSVNVPVQDDSPSAGTGLAPVGATVNSNVAHWPSLTNDTETGDWLTSTGEPLTSIVARI